jgi:phage terminase small subunit
VYRLARSRSPDSIKAEELYHSGMCLVDIAKKLKKPEGTVRRWKSTQEWDGKSERSEKKDEHIASVRKEIERKKKKAIAEDVKQVMDNPDLTDKQRLFCLHYIKSFNAVKSYQKAYGVGYNTAAVNGYRLLDNARIKAEIQRLKQNRLNREMLDESDIFQKYMDIAFADITDFLEFGREEVPVMTAFGPLVVKDEETGEKTEVTKVVNSVRFREHDEVDGTLISEVKQGRDGASIKLPDRMKALDWLTEHMDFANPEQRERLKLLEAQRKAIERDNYDNASDENIIITDTWAGESNEED